ncbi:protein-tyrosine phosphatase-like protein [Pilobolus umbonatus]|nr:protein-tyrosine phosphatase-like protein [Pilobolus umbonatus]
MVTLGRRLPITVKHGRKNKKNLKLTLSAIEIPKNPAMNNNAYNKGPIQIMDHLYLGSEQSSSDMQTINQLNIQAILNVAAEVNHPYDYLFQPMQQWFISPSPLLGYHKLPWQHNQDNLVVELQTAIEMIDRARSAGSSILVHCQCGVARSATLIVAYVMKTMQLPMHEAYQYVKSLAPDINPNLSLLFQLGEYEKTLPISWQQTLSDKSKLLWSTMQDTKWKSDKKSICY